MAKPTIASYGPAEHRAAIARGTLIKFSPTAIMGAHYDAESHHLLLDLYNGAHVALPVADIQELQGHSAGDLERVEVSPTRDGLVWRSIDVGISAPRLLTDFFGSAVHAQLGNSGGRRVSPAKARAARANGAKGGRPRAKTTTD